MGVHSFYFFLPSHFPLPTNHTSHPWLHIPITRIQVLDGFIIFSSSTQIRDATKYSKLKDAMKVGFSFLRRIFNSVIASLNIPSHLGIPRSCLLLFRRIFKISSRRVASWNSCTFLLTICRVLGSLAPAYHSFIASPKISSHPLRNFRRVFDSSALALKSSVASWNFLALAHHFFIASLDVWLLPVFLLSHLGISCPWQLFFGRVFNIFTVSAQFSVQVHDSRPVV